MTLPAPGEVHRFATLHCQCGHAAHLIAIRDAAVILTPRGLLPSPAQVCASDVMMDVDFGAVQAGKVFFRGIGARTVRAARLLAA